MNAGGTFDLNSFNQTIGSLAGAGSVTLGAATLTTGSDNTSTTFSGTISGTGGLTKIGAGTLVLTGNNPYSGATAVNGGRLTVNGAIPNSTLTVDGAPPSAAPAQSATRSSATGRSRPATRSVPSR